MSVSWSFGDGRFCPHCALRKFHGYMYRGEASVDMDISMDIHVKICGYGYGYGWEISYPRQACICVCFCESFFVDCYSI